jgi:hypothetical protein
MNNELNEVSSSLIIHFLNEGTIEEAETALTEMGIPDEIGAMLPGMIYDSTFAAVSIIREEHTLDEVVELMKDNGAPEEEVRDMVSLALTTIKENMDDE